MAAHVAAGWISCYVAILNCTFQNNVATSTQPGASFDELQGSGGAIWTNAPLLWIHNSSFVGNAATTVGGAVLYIATALPVSCTARVNKLITPFTIFVGQCMVAFGVLV